MVNKGCEVNVLLYKHKPENKLNVSTVWLIVFSVSTANVSLEIVSLVASVRTVWASVGLLPCVGSLVPFQFVSCLEGLGADRAGVATAAVSSSG